jgi:beta-glucosidase
VRELKGFQRVTVPAGSTTRVSFSVGPAQRRYWLNGEWMLDESTFDVWVGSLTGSFEV